MCIFDYFRFKKIAKNLLWDTRYGYITWHNKSQNSYEGYTTTYNGYPILLDTMEDEGYTIYFYNPMDRRCIHRIQSPFFGYSLPWEMAQSIKRNFADEKIRSASLKE